MRNHSMPSGLTVGYSLLLFALSALMFCASILFQRSWYTLLGITAHYGGYLVLTRGTVPPKTVLIVIGAGTAGILASSLATAFLLRP